MKLISLNVARPRLIVYNGVTINTGIFKQPVSGPVHLRTLNLDGDRQADLSVHGGPYKAVYAYPSEHYPYWRKQLPGMELSWGIFGENFSTAGMSEDELHIGDRLQIGSAVLMVRQPRMPCYKLAARFQRDDMIERFLRSGRSGVYFSVEQEGEVAAGDSLNFLSRDSTGITIAEMNRLFAKDKDKDKEDKKDKDKEDKYDHNLLQKAINTSALPEDWRDYFADRLERPAVKP